MVGVSVVWSRLVEEGEKGVWGVVLRFREAGGCESRGGGILRERHCFEVALGFGSSSTHL